MKNFINVEVVNIFITNSFLMPKDHIIYSTNTVDGPNRIKSASQTLVKIIS